MDLKVVSANDINERFYLSAAKDLNVVSTNDINDRFYLSTARDPIFQLQMI